MRRRARAARSRISQSFARQLLKAGESGVPEIVDEIAHGGEALHPDRIQVSDARLPRLNEPGVLQHLEVARYRRPAYRQPPCYIADSTRARAQLPENGAPHRISQSVEDVHCVTNRLRSWRRQE